MAETFLNIKVKMQNHSVRARLVFLKDKKKNALPYNLIYYTNCLLRAQTRLIENISKK